VALGEVASFVRSNRADLTTDISGLADITGTLAKQKDALAETLDAGPVALSNLQNAYNPASGTLDTRDNAQQLDDPGLFLCSLLTSLGQPKGVCDQIDKVLKNKQFAPPGGLPQPGGGPDLTLGGILGSNP
jgi:phospholipid/cholesterol/gamma-HCH transport system substrate-binding protein